MLVLTHNTQATAGKRCPRRSSIGSTDDGAIRPPAPCDPLDRDNHLVSRRADQLRYVGELVGAVVAGSFVTVIYVSVVVRPELHKDFLFVAETFTDDVKVSRVLHHLRWARMTKLQNCWTQHIYIVQSAKTKALS